ncbi:hypothetical protein V5O48_012999, partial [Marasmius crinis-equi]
MSFCQDFNLLLNPSPTTLAHYIAHSSKNIASGPKYLSGAKHFLKDAFPGFSEAHSSPY